MERVEGEVVSDDKSTDGKEEKEPEKNKIYYVTDEKQQSQYINMFKSEGLNAVILTHNIDQPFIQQIEQDNEKLAFLRIDADISDSLKSEGSEKELKEDEETLSKLFKKVLGKDKLEVKAQFLKDASVSSVITLSEESRRMSDMMKMYSMSGVGGDDMFGGGETLTLNLSNPLVKFLLEHKKGKKVEIICEQLYDLAMLSHRPLSPEAMTKFVARSNEIMEMISK